MKSTMMLAAMFCLVTTTAVAQQDSTLHTSANTPALAKLLSAYYDLKDALVASNAASATAKAAAFSKELKGLDASMLATSEQTALSNTKGVLMAEAEQIAGSSNIVKQRKQFAGFSLAMWNLIQASANNLPPVYQQYCPMQKAYWLSSEQAIRNPYYGKQMLTCGNVSATL